MAMNITEKQYITKQELCQICNISESTAYKLLKSKKLNFEKCCDGLLHYYKIPLCEVQEYMREQAEKGHYSEKEKEMISRYYRKKLKDYPDLIRAKDIQSVTGYGKESIRKWINSKKILGVVVRKRFAVAKDDLIDFLVSPYYANIIRKSEKHISDFRNIGIS